MNTRFDPFKQTLTKIGLSRLKPETEAAAAPTAEAVPQGRTTYKLSRNGGIIAPVVAEQAAAYGRQEAPAAPAVPPAKSGRQPPAAPAVADAAATATPPPKPEPAIMADNVPETFPEEMDRQAAADERPTVPTTEAAAALGVRAMRTKKPKPAPLPDDSAQLHVRLTQYKKDIFEKTCRDRGTIPSIILRNMIDQYCGL